MRDDQRNAPALTPDEWEKGFPEIVTRSSDGVLLPGLRGSSARVFARAEYGSLTLGEGVPELQLGAEALPLVIALANAALPDKHARKITRDLVAELRLVTEKYLQLAPLLDILESYLPPEGA